LYRPGQFITDCLFLQAILQAFVLFQLNFQVLVDVLKPGFGIFLLGDVGAATPIAEKAVPESSPG
jgi:hypothetical protein